MKNILLGISHTLRVIKTPVDDMYSDIEDEVEDIDPSNGDDPNTQP